MTYCLAIRVNEGLVALADGRLTSGTQVTQARKLSILGDDPNRLFIMTSGLRSVRDKALIYMKRETGMADSDEPSDRDRTGSCRTLLDVLDAFTAALRRVAQEDRDALARSDLAFNLHALIGGQLADDPLPTAFLVFPEGNWVEIGSRTPYLSIGATTYGKPILDRALSVDTPMAAALKLAYLSFDSTRFSTADVGYPIDMATYRRVDRSWRLAHFDYEDLVEQRQWWNRNLTDLAARMPDGPWVDRLIGPDAPKLSVVPGGPPPR